MLLYVILNAGRWREHPTPDRGRSPSARASGQEPELFSASRFSMPVSPLPQTLRAAGKSPRSSISPRVDAEVRHAAAHAYCLCVAQRSYNLALFGRAVLTVLEYISNTGNAPPPPPPHTHKHTHTHTHKHTHVTVVLVVLLYRCAVVLLYCCAVVLLCCCAVVQLFPCACF